MEKTLMERAFSRIGERVKISEPHRNAKAPAPASHACVRQGDWFFIPVPDLEVDPQRILRQEPLRRSGGKPHWVDELYRTRGNLVYVCSRYPDGVSEDTYQELRHNNPASRFWDWDVRAFAEGVYVRGRVRHPDHKTIRLDGWHLVLMNTENESRSRRNARIID